MNSQIVRTDVPYDYQTMVSDLEALKSAYPIIQSNTIGSSVLGKEIYALSIGIGQRQVYYNGCHHANEWITAPLLMQFAESYAQAYQTGTTILGWDIRYLFNHTIIWLTPMVNPDGVDLVIHGIDTSNPFYEQVLRWNNYSTNFSNWKANIRGVDLNHQYNAHWYEQKSRGPVGPGPANYSGSAPESEPESRAVADFTRYHNPNLIIAYHSQGRVIYWGYRGLEPPESQTIATYFGTLSGYTPIRYAGTDAGYKDWFIQDWRRPGFTIEVGMGINPLPTSQLPQIYRENLGTMLHGASLT
jgi:g-D-glutamyl-meso-diaminopimelate peptidase